MLWNGLLDDRYDEEAGKRLVKNGREGVVFIYLELWEEDGDC